MRKYILLGIFLFLTVSGLQARDPYKGGIGAGVVSYEKAGDMVTLDIRIDLSRLELRRCYSVELTPVLRSKDNVSSIVFDPVLIVGRTRANLMERAARFGDLKLDREPQLTQVLSKNGEKEIGIRQEARCEAWMRDSELVILERTIGCAGKSMAYDDGSRAYVTALNFGEPYTPIYKVAYVEPEVSEKNGSETHAANLNFHSGKSMLMRDYMNNNMVLSEVDAVIGRLRNDPDIKITSIIVTGWSSPDGNEAVNHKLSEERAMQFLTYLHWKHNLYEYDNVASVKGRGEDWQGLRKLVERSALPDRSKILLVIDDVYDVADRKRIMRTMGSYRFMSDVFYPQLRRNEYTINYSVRAYPVEEARELVKTNPKVLSLNEMFMVADSYRRGSGEFNQVFDVAVRMYPSDPVAQVNAAAAETENGSYSVAEARLAEHATPVAWNNLGVVYWNTGRYDKAREYFRKAADAGLAEAKHNLEEYRKWDDNR